MKLSILLFVCFVGAIVAQNCTNNALKFNADLRKPTTEWNHYWERCVGSGHAVLALRQDYREAMKLAHDNLGIQMVRFHGIFDDDMSVFQMGTGPNDKPVYSFYNIDNIFDWLLSIGMKPLVELSFMPEDMASGNSTIFHYKGNTTPPKDWLLWHNLIVEFAKHIIERYGIHEIRSWYFETWNEPNCGFWSGTQDEYFHLLKVTSNALKSVDSQLRVGGPATCHSDWLPETLDYVKKNGVALDFISTHQYPTDIPPLTRSVMKLAVQTARNQVGKDMPLFYTEYNDGLFEHSLHDNTYASAFAVFNVIDVYGIPDLFSWWSFSDIFEEGGFNSIPFNEGYGLQTIYNIAKPSFRAFELLHQTGDRRVPVTGVSHSTAGMLATKNSTHLTVLLYNHDVPDAAIKTESVCVTIDGVSTRNPAYLRRIDEKHCNPLALWKSMGSPTYPTHAQIHKLKVVSEFVVEKVDYSVTGSNQISFQVDVPPQGVVGIVMAL